MAAAQLQSLLGLLLIPLVAWAISRERAGAGAALRIAAGGIAVQLAVAGLLFSIPGIKAAFGWVAGLVSALQAASNTGMTLVFGYLAGGPAPFEVVAPQNAFVLAFQALPLILLVSALTRLLYHWGILQRVVAVFAWALRRALGVDGPVGTAAAANIFVGMVEAPLLVRPYLAAMDRGGLFAVMTVGLATIAGTVFALYASLVAGAVPDAAGHLIVASVISAPAALMIARLMIPSEGSTRQPDLAEDDTQGPLGSFDAITQGVGEGVALLVNVTAMLVVFVALIALIDLGLALIAAPLGVELTVAGIAGWVFAPAAWAIGVPWDQAPLAGSLLGIKTMVNEFAAYLTLAGEAGAGLDPRARLIMVYALSGFANFGSVGIMIGGMTAMVPERRAEIVELGLLALVSGTFSTLMTGAVIGLITTP